MSLCLLLSARVSPCTNVISTDSGPSGSADVEPEPDATSREDESKSLVSVANPVSRAPDDFADGVLVGVAYVADEVAAGEMHHVEDEFQRRGVHG